MKKRKLSFKISHDETKLESKISSGDFSLIKDDSIRAAMLEAAQSRNRVKPNAIARTREGVPHQALIASLLRKHTTDQNLDEKAILAAVKKLAKK